MPLPARLAPRYYTPDKLGPLCAADCGWRIPLALSNQGIITHPTCGPAKVRRKERRRKG